MYIPFSFLKPQRATVSFNGLRIWNTYGGYNSSSGVWQDISGNNNSGSVLGSTLTEVSGGYLFDGTTNFVLYNDIVNKAYDVPHPLLFNMTISIFGTFSTEVKNPYGFAWFGWDNQGPKNGFFSAFDNFANPDNLAFVATAGGTELTFTAPYSYTENEKAMFTIVVQGDEVKWYKNTQLFYSASYAFDPILCGNFSPGYPLRFGASGSSDVNKFSGSVSNLLMYNTSLTATEIANNYTYLSSI
jgi:hypothetical protein